MNCPGSMFDLRSRARSYRELPMRLAEFAPLHRFEPSGTLHGLTRVREFVQDDAHIFVTEEQVEDEIRTLLAWIERAFATFRLEWSCELSTRPAQFLGEAAVWDRAEATLERVLKSSGSKVPGLAGRRRVLRPEDRHSHPRQPRTTLADRDHPARLPDAPSLRSTGPGTGRPAPSPDRRSPDHPRLLGEVLRCLARTRRGSIAALARAAPGPGPSRHRPAHARRARAGRGTSSGPPESPSLRNRGVAREASPER